MIFVREERSEYIGAIRMVNEQAFGQPAEAGIVDRLRKSGPWADFRINFDRDIATIDSYRDGSIPQID